jgi:glutamine synthetase
MTINPETWLREHGIDEIECMVADLTGMPRGKILPRDRFLRCLTDNSLRMPGDVFYQTVTGEYPDPFPGDETSPDMILHPDVETLRRVPWYEDPTAQVMCHVTWRDGSPVETSPRGVLQRVLDLYAAKGLTPVVAPELEFYLVAKNIDPDYPLEPPVGRSGRTESGRQAYGLDAVNEFDHVVDDIYDFCEAARVDLDTLIHEAGPAQLEVNFNHGDPMALADMVMVFKRVCREAAMRHDVYCTFMAKPIEGEAGSAMHIHQSVVTTNGGKNIFADTKGKDTKVFRHYIGGLQKFLPSAMPLFAPNVNSYRRLRADSDAPINTHWGFENRTVGLRVPESDRRGRRVENRVPGVDVNPYLAMAATLACGYLGMEHKIEPGKTMDGNAYLLKSHGLPRHLPDALQRLHRCRELREILGDEFVDLVVAVKQAEHDEYQDVISPWEREHLLLNV